IRQLLTESVLLALAGAVAGLMVAAIGLRVTTLKIFSIPHLNSIEINVPVLVFTLAAATIAGMLFGIFPAVQTSRPDLHDELRSSVGTSGMSRRRRFTSNALVVTEVALSVLLLISSGLLLKDFIRLRNNDIGVRSENVWTGQMKLPHVSYSEPQKQFNFFTVLLARAKKIPGVESAAISNRVPLEGGSNNFVKLRGNPSTQWESILVESHSVTPGYFRALGIPLLQGRDFTDEDLQRSLELDLRAERLFKDGKPHPEETDHMIYPSVINEKMANIFWPNQNPLGQLYSPNGKSGPWQQVIGVVGDVKRWGLAQPAKPEGYTAFDGDSHLFLMLHTSTPLAGIAQAVRHELASLDSSLALFNVRSMSDVIADNAAGEQFITLLIGIFASLALLLAAVGIYGVLSYAVTQRTQKIGIRMSLGATRPHIFRLLFGQGSPALLPRLCFRVIFSSPAP